MRGITEIAAEWWINMISKRELGTFNTYEEKEPIQTEKLQKFKTLLEERIKVEIDRRGICSLRTNDSPEELLRDTILESGLPIEKFPWKTNMVIKANSVQVSYGYAAKPVML